MSRRSWAKLMTDWHEDRVLVAVAAEHGPRVYAYFAVMIAECKRRLNNGGDGVWEVSDAAFAAATGDIKGRRKTRLLVLQTRENTTHGRIRTHWSPLTISISKMGRLTIREGVTK